MSAFLALARGAVILICGIVVGINLVHLVGFNPAYEASWWKVVAAVAFGCFMALRIKEQQ